jgi:hypothetical protein
MTRASHDSPLQTLDLVVPQKVLLVVDEPTATADRIAEALP